MNDDEKFLASIEKFSKDIDGWHWRAGRTPPEQPEAGSELAADDANFRWHPLSESARLSLVSAGEHLRLARDALRAGQVYPSAHFVVLRGGLVGASQAVWLLHPDRAEIRRERGLMLFAEMYKRLEQSYSTLNDLELDANEREQLAQQVEWIRERKLQVESQRTTRLALTQTSMIHDALDVTFTDMERRTDGRILWQQMSSDAHVLGWGVAQRYVSATPVRGTPHAVLAVPGSVRAVAQPYGCVHALLKRGWSLFDRRCESRH